MCFKTCDIIIYKKDRSLGIGFINKMFGEDILSVNFGVSVHKLFFKDDLKYIEKIEKTVENLLIIHKRTLERLNIPYSGIRSPNEYKLKRRKTHCYNCKHNLDNYSDYECNTCGWIICWCGCCGCEYV